MRLLDSISIDDRGRSRAVQLLEGDLTEIPREHACDVLVVSSFRNSYAPTPGTLVGALDRKGVKLHLLAEAKEADLRETSSCWLSTRLDRADLNVGRILCYEPVTRHLAAELVGDVFRSLFPFIAAEPHVRKVALPLLASGRQRQPDGVMLTAILEAAVHWLSAGLALDELKIVIRQGMPPADRDRLLGVFKDFRDRLGFMSLPGQQRTHTAYDLFVSYSHHDKDAVRRLCERVRYLSPGARLFFDEVELDAGKPWQQEIYAAIDAAQRVVCLYSPDYLRSKPCMEEFNIAMLRHREEGEVLVPAYLRTADLPSYMRTVQYADVRESDDEKLESLAHQIAARLNGGQPPQRPPSEKPKGGGLPTVGTKLDPRDLRAVVDALIAANCEIHVEMTIRPRSDSGAQ